jgi:ATP-dependent exoDNAse (exonuclease V) beta subunit
MALLSGSRHALEWHLADEVLAQRALSADRYEREVPFAAVLDDGLQLVGRMDLVFREGDELVVVDFKTDAVATAAEADSAAAAHSGQAAA